ncbi:carbohydrate ABC transporter permease (plasmid) [Coraliomargarita sp. W4R53]
MVAPPLVFVCVFILVPIVIAVFLSFTNWNGFTSPDWIGPRNYTRLFEDPETAYAAGLTAIITVVGTVLCNVFGLGVALLVNGRSKFNSSMRAVVFYPHVIGAIIIGFLWSSILSTNGAANALLRSLGLDPLPFLADPTWAVVSVIAVLVWSMFGVNVILYLAGLQTIPDSLLEAARLDGASDWQIFWKVKLPLLAPVVTVNIVLVVVALLRVYELILALTDGGPAGRTQSIVFHMLSTSFGRAQLGYASAQAVVLLGVIVTLTIIITSLRRRSEEAVSA